MRTVRVASVGGRVRFVKTSEILPSVDMVRRKRGQEETVRRYYLGGICHIKRLFHVMK